MILGAHKPHRHDKVVPQLVLDFCFSSEMDSALHIVKAYRLV